MNEVTPEEKEKSLLNFKEKIGYLVFATGFQQSQLAIENFILYFYTDVMKLGGGIAGAIGMIVTLFDAVNDPVIGHYSVNHKAKNGDSVRQHLLYTAIGQLLGAGELERAVDEDRKLIAFAIALSVVLSAVMALTAPFFPLIYNTIPRVKHLASEILLVGALMMPLHAFATSCYFTVRSGGKTVITFLFDSGAQWLILVPAAFIIAHFTEIPIVPFFAIIEGLNLIKCAIGFVMVKQRHWVANLVGEQTASSDNI